MIKKFTFCTNICLQFIQLKKKENKAYDYLIKKE